MSATAGPSEGTQSLPPGLLEALQRPTNNLSSRLLNSFENVLEVTVPDSENAGATLNKFALACPRPGCGSLMLKPGGAKWVERASIQLEPTGTPAHSQLPPLPTPPETAQWWMVSPSFNAFENIGFTRQTRAFSEESRKSLKLIICAECDLGPLGWCEDGGTEFWLACSRVGYRV